ncbi:hypothetical protein F5888DRAFT_1801361 [Russula emetica]|nr:hypothetical protein F5888DRAFT_1801361 [Russula emetica]
MTPATIPPGIRKVKDIFESKFIIETVSPFLKRCENSSKNYGRPVSALAMAAAAMECAFKMYHSGEHKDVGQFSRDNRRWTTILEKCGTHSDQSDDESAGPNAQSMQNSRRALYTPSSPTKDD